MNGRLERLVKEALVAEWKSERNVGTIDSLHVYERLVEAGEDVPEGQMETILFDLKASGFIEGPQRTDRTGRRVHGAMTITWIDEQLL